jgi:hypothetical protein
MVQSALLFSDANLVGPPRNKIEAIHWIPALEFSVGLDALTTGMIAGRLIYHHRSRIKLGYGNPASPYLPLVTIFIESAALSLISKILQLVIHSFAITTNPLVMPLCVSKERTIYVIRIDG